MPTSTLTPSATTRAPTRDPQPTAVKHAGDALLPPRPHCCRCRVAQPAPVPQATPPPPAPPNGLRGGRSRAREEAGSIPPATRARTVAQFLAAPDRHKGGFANSQCATTWTRTDSLIFQTFGGSPKVWSPVLLLVTGWWPDARGRCTPPAEPGCGETWPQPPVQLLPRRQPPN